VGYDAWGNVRSGGSMPTDIGYTGQRLDNSTGLMYYRARYYAQGLGRFISADTLVPDGKNPQAFNRYAYVLNDPLKYIDPTGNFTEKELDKFYPGWRDWSDLLKELMLNRATTWGSILYLGYGGNEPSLIVMAALEQQKNGYNKFTGQFVGLGGTDFKNGNWYWRSPEELSKYTNGTAWFAHTKDSFYATTPEMFESDHAQHSKSNWIKNKTLSNITLPGGANLGPGIGLGWYVENNPVKLAWLIVSEGLDVVQNVTEEMYAQHTLTPNLTPVASNYIDVKYPAILVAAQLSYYNGNYHTFGETPTAFGDFCPPQPY
jgi:RHS repeat-associated protein